MAYTVDLAKIQEYNTHHYTVHPKSAALLVIEMQYIFLNEMNIITEDQANNIQNIIAAAERPGIKIIYVRHNDDSDISKSLVDWWGCDKIIIDKH